MLAMRMPGTVVVALCAFAAPARAATFNAHSCSVADIQAALAQANDRDTVLVPGGACTWTTALTLSKGLRLDGQSAADITFGPGGGLTLNASRTASTVVTGFAFHNGFINGGYPLAVSTSTAPFNVPFRIANNRFVDPGAQGGPVTLIGVGGFGPGLIDHNAFTTAAGADEVIHLLGSGGTADTSGWTNDVVPGGPNMIFLENNLFTNQSGSVGSSAEEAYYGVQFVFRYNLLSFEGNDVHQGGLSGRWAEIYGNSYGVAGQTINLSDYWQFRGGSGLVWGNTASSVACCQDPYPGAQFGPDCPSSDVCSGTWPIPSQVGTGINETTNSPAYVWGNTGTAFGATQDIQSRVYFANGIQGGATPTSCTHPGNICDVVASVSQPTTWVRCESAADLDAGCPVSYQYVPYPYPHPLDDLPPTCFGYGCPGGSDGGIDAGTGVDAGTGADAGSGGRDAGASVDGGAVDSGSSGPPPIHSGCGCASQPFALVAAGLLMLGLRPRRSKKRSP
jgi:hypothetical protein